MTASYLKLIAYCVFTFALCLLVTASVEKKVSIQVAKPASLFDQANQKAEWRDIKWDGMGKIPLPKKAFVKVAK